MLYEIWKFGEDIDLAKLKGQEMVVSKSEIPMLIEDKSSKASMLDIEEKIPLFDYLRKKKFSDDDIYELAEYTVNKLIPNASKNEKENAKKLYLEDTRTLKTKSFVIQWGGSTIIVCKKDQTATILKYLNVKQNMVINVFQTLGIPHEDFLLWICWVHSNSRTFPGIKIRRIIEDRTKDRDSNARSQKESGSRQILDSFDFNYRIGTGYPLNGLKFDVEDIDLGAHLEIGLFNEAEQGPMVTISALYVLKGTLKQMIDSLPNANQEIIKINLAIKLIYGLAKEYKNATTWKTSKPTFINSLMKNASQLFNGQQFDDSAT